MPSSPTLSGKVPVSQLPPSVVLASSPADTPAATQGGSQLVNVPPWKATTLYPQGYCVMQGGVIYTATTTFTSGASFGADGANWAAVSSVELGYAQITSNASGFGSTSFVAITGLSVTVTVAARPVLIRAYSPKVQNQTANLAGSYLGIFEDGTEIQEALVSLPAGMQFYGYAMNMTARSNPSAGSHTYTVRGKNADSNVTLVTAAATSPAFIQVTQL